MKQQQQPKKITQPGNKEMKIDKKQKYPNTTEQRLDEIKQTTEDLYGNASHGSNKDLKK